MWDALTTPAGVADVFSPLADIFLAVFCVGFIVSILLYNGGARRVASHPMTRRALRRAGGWGIGIFGAGLFFFGVRALQINPFGFGMPLWLWLCTLAAIVLVVWTAYDLLVLAPRRIQAYEQARLKQQYLRRGATPENIRGSVARASSKSSRGIR